MTMHNKRSTYWFVGILLLFASGCSKVLDKTAQDKYTETQVWTDINLADRYLLDTYNSSLTGGFGYLSFASITDESHDTHAFGTENYLQSNISSSNPIPFGLWAFNYTTWDAMYTVIQKLNTFLSKIDQVADNYSAAEKPAIEARASIMKGEALFLRAFCYSQLARNYGGVLLFTEPFEIGADYLSFNRSSFKETVDFIAGQCDDAASLLSDKATMELGRASIGSALALKSRILTFAASDLTADGTAVNEYVGYQNPDRTALWAAAKNAAKAVIDLDAYHLADFGAPDQSAVATNFFNFFKATDLSSNEIIWGKMFIKNVGAKNQMNLVNGSNGFNMYGCNAPTGNLADAFEMADGTPFTNHYQVNGSSYYTNISSTYTDANIYHNREPRFYGTILFDSAKWMARTADLTGRDPLGIYDRRTRVTISGGVETSRIYGIDTRQGPVDGDDGTYTGYTFKKYQDDAVYATETVNNGNVWIEMRYAEILLNYAEACLALGETAEGTTYVNVVRNRAALPDFTGDATAALRYERQIEFVHEDIRWYDSRRWKILPQTLQDAYGVDIVQTTNLDNNTVATTWRKIAVQSRGPVVDKMYWVPIPIAEMNRAPQLTQNPGY